VRGALRRTKLIIGLGLVESSKFLLKHFLSGNPLAETEWRNICAKLSPLHRTGSQTDREEPEKLDIKGKNIIIKLRSMI
jgi:hypothetical protein